MQSEFFLDLFDEYFPKEEALCQFANAVHWGSSGELFEPSRQAAPEEA